MRPQEILKLKNLGPKSAAWLNEVGVFSEADIERIGSLEIYRLLKQRGYPASLNMLYALEGVVLGIDWRKLPEMVKADLKSQAGR